MDVVPSMCQDFWAATCLGWLLAIIIWFAANLLAIPAPISLGSLLMDTEPEDHSHHVAEQRGLVILLVSTAVETFGAIYDTDGWWTAAAAVEVLAIFLFIWANRLMMRSGESWKPMCGTAAVLLATGGSLEMYTAVSSFESIWFVSALLEACGGILFLLPLIPIFKCSSKALQKYIDAVAIIFCLLPGSVMEIAHGACHYSPVINSSESKLFWFWLISGVLDTIGLLVLSFLSVRDFFTSFKQLEPFIPSLPMVGGGGGGDQLVPQIAEPVREPTRPPR